MNQPLSNPPADVSISPKVEIRIERLQGWHHGIKAAATRLKLFVFLAGAEITAIKDDLDIKPGPISETVSLIGIEGSWKDWLALQSGMTYRTMHNYEIAYKSMCQAAPDLAIRILKAADMTLTIGDDKPLALQLRIDDTLTKIKPEDITAFAEALDPWTLSELYRRPLKPAKQEEANQAAKASAEKRDRHEQLTFWESDFARRVKNNDYLTLPKPKRAMLLDELEDMVRNLKNSLRKEG